ncbi:MAG TPA: LCP family protein [Gaiellaceae bacterium]|nr:LCP family protein [Gaiellaceae bacterium]
MRTTLKRGVGRGAGLNGKNGHAVLPPATETRVVRYRADPRRRGAARVLSKILVGTLLIVVALALGIGGGSLLYLHQSLGDVRAHSQDVLQSEKELDLTAPGHAAIALVVGYDQRAGSEFSTQSRSDTVMMIRADPQTKTISLLSIPRDLGVPIWCPKDKTGPVDSDNKINQAYADCGAKGTVDTIKHLTSLPINYLITVNFHGFKEIVDKLGGIWMDVDRRYYHVNNGTAAEDYANINIHPGYQLLSGEQALDFVRYRHTDDDYHRIARQQEFVRALKQQFSHTSLTKVPSLIKTLDSNVEVGGSKSDLSDTTVLRWMYFALTLPGGHFFQDKIANVTGNSVTYTAPSNITAAIDAFTHPDVAQSKAANAAALGQKVKRTKAQAPAPGKTSVLVLNGNGVGGSAANGAYLLRQKGYVTVLPPNGAAPNAPAQNHFHTLIYYDKRQSGSKLAASALAKLLVPSDVGPLPKDLKLRALDPGAMVTVVLGTTFHNQLESAPPPPAAPQHVAPNVRFDSTTGLSLLQPYEHRVPFTLEVPTELESSSVPDTYGGDDASRLYWIDKGQHEKAIRLVFRTGAGEFWGIEETNMPNPPILSDKSFQRAIKGREFSLYYSGSSLQMVVLRVHDKSYWVVNTLLDSLSNETMLHIAEGLKPLAAHK